MRDSYKRFVPYRGSWILTLKDLFCIVSHESSQFSKNSFRGFVSWRIFKRFDESDESYESSQILSTIDLWIHTNPVLPDSRIQSIFKRFVSWRNFQIPVSWIRFVRPKISKDSICFISEGFVYESRILTVNPFLGTS